MNEELKPALSAKEWKHGITLSEACDRYETQAVMALANDSLSDDSPYKITRADVEAVRDAWELAVDYNNHEPDNEAQVVALDRIRAKLAALLPPERT